MYYLPNYVRMALVVLFLMVYLRPKAILGVLAVLYNMYSAFQAQQRRNSRIEDKDQETRGKERLQRREQPSTAQVYLAVVTWILVTYSGCLPIMLLSLVLSLVFIALHASLRQSQSEGKYRGKSVVCFKFSDVLRRKRGGTEDPWALFKDMYRVLILERLVYWKKWGVYYALTLWDQMKSFIFRR